MSTISRSPLAVFPEDYPATEDFTVIPKDGLIGWFEYDEGSGTVLTDKSGAGNHGTISGSPVWVDEGLSFDGVDDRIVTTVPETAEFTWISLFNIGASPPPIQVLMGNFKTVGGVSTGASVLTISTDNLRLTSSRDTGTAVNSEVVDKAVAGEWRIAVMSRWGTGTAARQKIAVSEKYRDEDSLVSGVGVSTDPLALGDAFVPTALKFKGTKGLELFYNRRLTPDEETQVRFYFGVKAAQRGFSITST